MGEFSKRSAYEVTFLSLILSRFATAPGFDEIQETHMQTA
jgi:hypothetical protein